MSFETVGLRPDQRAFLERFVNACQEDDRVVAAFLGGSYAKGYADACSDVDLCVITTDTAFDAFRRDREAFLRSLGRLEFLEDFGNPNTAHYMYADGMEGELNFASEGRLGQIHAGPFQPLLDKKNILEGTVFSEDEPARSDQVEKLRSDIQGFWHELSHFLTAMQRGQSWWAQGQLEALRAICVNLARLRHNLLDGDAGEEAYFKVEKGMPVEPLAPLKATFGPMEQETMLRAVVVIVDFYVQIAPPLAQEYGLPYSQALERVMKERLRSLQEQRPGARA